MEETLREAPPDGWRQALAQTIEQQRQKVGQRIATQRERLRELEGKLAQHLGDATQALQKKQDAARDASAKTQADEAAARQRTTDLARREQELAKKEAELSALTAKANGAANTSPAGGKLLDDLSRRLTELDQRQAKQADEEKRLTARQQELTLRAAELDQLQAGLSGQTAAHQSRSDDLARQQAELDKARQAHQAEAARYHQQQTDIRKLESDLKLQSQKLTERERETLRQRRHVAQQLRARKKELTAEIELHRSEARAAGAGEEHQVELRLTELQGKFDRARDERDQREQQRDDAVRKLAETKGQLEARQSEAAQQQKLLEQAQKKQAELEAERQRLQTDLQRHLEDAGRKAEAARIEGERRTADAQKQAAEIARLGGELERVRRDSQEQIDRLRADHGKSHDAQVQSLHSQLEELRKKILAEQAGWETQRKQLEGQVKAAEQKAASSGGKGNPAAEKELATLQQEHKLLEARLHEAEHKAKSGGGGGGQELEDLKRRFEMAVQDVRDLKTKNSTLTEELAKARQAGGGSSAASGGSDWESMKKRMMEQLSDVDEGDEKQKADKLTIENAMKMTDEVVAEKEKEIQELRRALDSQAQSVGEVAVGAAAIAQMLDTDELIKQERDSLQKLQESLREQLRKAEIDISLERAKLARERAELDEKLRTIEAERPAAGAAAEADKGKKGGSGGRKWLERLGLGENKS